MANIPKVVVFDLGKVLVDFDYGRAIKRIAAQSERDEGSVRQLLDQSALLIRYETGLLTRHQFFQELSSGAGYRGDFKEFCSHFTDIFWEIKPMIALHALLREHKIPTFIFSNTNDLQLEYIRTQFPFFSNFTGYILSYEHGAMKPDGKLYDVVERATGRSGEDIVYLDDRAENVATALARGWRGVVHEAPEKSFAALKSMGLPTPVN